MVEAQTVNPCLSKCMSQKRSIYSNRTVSCLIILLELLTVLLVLEYIDFLSDMHFDKQEFIALHKFSPYYASIMLNAFRHLLCSLLCQHNRRVPNHCLTGNKKFVGVRGGSRVWKEGGHLSEKQLKT